jgi:ElaB/YqjD/DUF883 family membrane-anchored ribosome-binding protein
MPRRSGRKMDENDRDTVRMMRAEIAEVTSSVGDVLSDCEEAKEYCSSARMRAAKVISSQKIRAAARVAKGGK